MAGGRHDTALDGEGLTQHYSTGCHPVESVHQPPSPIASADFWEQRHNILT